MRRHYFSILFFIRKTKLLKNGEAPICLRVTVDGQRAEIQIKRSVNINNWNSQKECAIGRDAHSRELNHYLEIVRTKVLSIHGELERNNKAITASIIINIYNGKSESAKMLLSVFNEQNKKYRELIGRDYVLATVLRYERTVKYLSEFIKLNYQMQDIPLKNINNAFIVDFEHFIKTQKKCAQNAAVKYLKNLKRIIKFALANKWIEHNPFTGIQFHQTKSNREFLVEEELNILLQKKFSIPRLEVVRDIFIFCCFTGLAFTDIKNLRPQHVVSDKNGSKWIFKTREKTDNMCHMPSDLYRLSQLLTLTWHIPVIEPTSLEVRPSDFSNILWQHIRKLCLLLSFNPLSNSLRCADVRTGVLNRPILGYKDNNIN